ncbi:MAG: hypothetical protein ACTSPB_20425 [Candidatus Thorarchaeota archaeon]
MSGIEEYEGLAEAGYESRQPVSPEDEFYHSIYVAGQSRKNQSGVQEVAEKLQVRGVEYNLGKAYMIITHVKALLAKIDRDPSGRESVKCFSYQQGDPPWYGTSGVKCGINSAERVVADFCNPCRAQLVVGGLYCDAQGNPVVDKEKKPTFVFIRGKGMKYSRVADYINNLQSDDFEPIFTPVTDESKRFEKIHVNNKRFVTEIGVATEESNWGPRQVFDLSRGVQLSNETVMNVLRITKKTLDKFNEKFDWSRGKQVSGYAETAAVPPEQQIPEVTPPPEAAEQPAAQSTEQPVQPTQTEPAKQFTFDDIDF